MKVLRRAMIVGILADVEAVGRLGKGNLVSQKVRNSKFQAAEKSRTHPFSILLNCPSAFGFLTSVSLARPPECRTRSYRFG